jgi:peptide/nickel transport system substrate-binding protein
MTGNRLRFLVLSLLASFTFVVTACGDDDKKSSSGTDQKAATKEAAKGKQGGKLTQLGASDVDFLDPGRTYYTAGFQVLFATHRTLYSFTPDDSVKPVPDLADGEPQISSDKSTVTVKLKKGIKFSPPVNREVTSADVKYAFERFFTKQVAGQYPGYFNMISGTPKKPGDYKPISGITTPDDSTVVFKLDDPVGVAFAAALVMPISAPVPKEYAQKFDKKNPSTYGNNAAFTGPYMVKNNAAGKLVGYKAGKSIELVRNPNWDKATDYKPAYLDEIKLVTNASDANVSSRQVLSGQNLVLDTNPPAPILKQVVSRYKDQYAQVPSGGYRYFPMNTTLKPFDDLNVRKAVVASFDRDAARLARGGKFVGDLPTHFLPPEFPGFEEAGGFEGPGYDFINKKNEKGDPALAAEYMKKAGYASGKYEGNEELLMIGANVAPGKDQSEVAKAEFEKLGFKVKLRLLPQDAVYTEWCQVPAKKVHVCAGSGWFKDFADPQSMLEPTFKGSLIMKDGGNNNLAQLNDPAINKAMDEAALLEGAERLKAWGEIDKMIMAQAPAVPFAWDKTTLISSKNVAAVAASYFTAWDLSFTSIK